MEAGAIVMMVITILVVWGGFVASVVAWNAAIVAGRKNGNPQLSSLMEPEKPTNNQ